MLGDATYCSLSVAAGLTGDFGRRLSLEMGRCCRLSMRPVIDRTRRKSLVRHGGFNYGVG